MSLDKITDTKKGKPLRKKTIKKKHDRNMKIVEKLRQGKTYQEIADDLAIGIATVKRWAPELAKEHGIDVHQGRPREGAHLSEIIKQIPEGKRKRIHKKWKEKSEAADDYRYTAMQRTLQKDDISFWRQMLSEKYPDECKNMSDVEFKKFIMPMWEEERQKILKENEASFDELNDFTYVSPSDVERLLEEDGRRDRRLREEKRDKRLAKLEKAGVLDEVQAINANIEKLDTEIKDIGHQMIKKDREMWDVLKDVKEKEWRLLSASEEKESRALYEEKQEMKKKRRMLMDEMDNKFKRKKEIYDEVGIGDKPRVPSKKKRIQMDVDSREYKEFTKTTKASSTLTHDYIKKHIDGMIGRAQSRIVHEAMTDLPAFPTGKYWVLAHFDDGQKYKGITHAVSVLAKLDDDGRVEKIYSGEPSAYVHKKFKNVIPRNVIRIDTMEWHNSKPQGWNRTSAVDTVGYKWKVGDRKIILRVKTDVQVEDDHAYIYYKDIERV